MASAGQAIQPTGTFNMEKSKITVAFHALRKANAHKGKPRKYAQWGGTRSMRKAWARQWAKTYA
jgi:hypothetical protein